MRGAPYKLIARVGPQTRKDRFAALEDALAALEGRIGRVGREPRREVLGREYEPVKQVAGRFEIKGPRGVRGGVDVRGDGSAEAFRGWIRRVLIEQQPGETAVDALRRELSQDGS